MTSKTGSFREEPISWSMGAHMPLHHLTSTPISYSQPAQHSPTNRGISPATAPAPSLKNKHLNLQHFVCLALFEGGFTLTSGGVNLIPWCMGALGVVPYTYIDVIDRHNRCSQWKHVFFVKNHVLQALRYCTAIPQLCHQYTGVNKMSCALAKWQ